MRPAVWTCPPCRLEVSALHLDASRFQLNVAAVQHEVSAARLQESPPHLDVPRHQPQKALWRLQWREGYRDCLYEGSGRLVRSCAAPAALSRGLSGRDVRSP